VHTSHEHPIIGTPCDVPVPKNVSLVSFMVSSDLFEPSYTFFVILGYDAPRSALKTGFFATVVPFFARKRVRRSLIKA
jgi:hypothetical protein